MKNYKYKILVVDDVKENLTIIRNIFSDADYETDIVEDGPSAVEIVKKNNYDLILLDIMMPIMSGIEVCQYLKEDPNTAQIPVIFLTANADRDTLIRAYEAGGSDYIKKPFFKEELLARVEARLKLRDYEKNLEEKVKQRTKEISDTKTELMYAIGAIAEGHSEYIYSHLDRVAQFSYKLAKLYGFDEKEASLIRDASALHDIGKSTISDDIVNKNGPLDAKEQKEMQKHVMAGYELLKDSKVELFQVGAIIAQQHHEKFDGTGYPKKRRGERIHIYARIVTLADVYDSLVYNRIKKDGWTQEEILSYIKDMRGKYFDPDLVDIFFNNLDDFLDIYEKEIEQEVIEELQKNDEKKVTKIAKWLFRKK